MEREDDVQLIRKTLSGDDTAFGLLVEKYQKSVHALVWRKIDDFHYAEDIMQDAFLQAYKKLSTLKNPNQFAGWLYVIANRLCIDWMRKQKWMREQKFVMQSLADTSAEEIEKSSYTYHVSEQSKTERTEHCHALVKKLLEKLPESERTVVMLYYLDEMPTKEIGKFLGVSVNTIVSRLHRARKRLQIDQELLFQEVLDDVQLSENLKENIMSQLESIRSKFDSFIAQAKSDPTSGQIFIDDVPLHQYRLESLRQKIAPVFQDFSHFFLSAGENIGIGNVEQIHNEAAVIQAAAQGQADTIVSQLSDGYETLLGRHFDGGTDLSGGEWQKIAISRAFMRDAQILILDEPTAALDAESEYALFQRFKTLTQGVTTLLISHRFSTVRMADRILVIDAGKILEEGTHEQLMNKSGKYATLYRMQSEKYK